MLFSVLLFPEADTAGFPAEWPRRQEHTGHLVTHFSSTHGGQLHLDFLERLTSLHLAFL